MLLKTSQQGLQLCLKTHFNQRLAQDVIGVQGGENFNFRTLDLGIPKK